MGNPPSPSFGNFVPILRIFLAVSIGHAVETIHKLFLFSLESIPIPVRQCGVDEGGLLLMVELRPDQDLENDDSGLCDKTIDDQALHVLNSCIDVCWIMQLTPTIEHFGSKFLF